MTKRVGSIVLIEREPDSTCELCGTKAETRPYGPNGKRVCYQCGMKNRKETEAHYTAFLLATRKLK